MTTHGRKYAFVAAGGMLGAIARYGIKLSPVFHNPLDFPLQTLMTNLAGCFLIAFILTAAETWLDLDPAVRAGIIGGFLGAFTTFSTYCREAWQLLAGPAFLTGLLYFVASPLLGLAAILLGAEMSRICIGRKRGEEKPVEPHRKRNPPGASGSDPHTGGGAE